MRNSISAQLITRTVRHTTGQPNRLFTNPQLRTRYLAMRQAQTKQNLSTEICTADRWSRYVLPVTAVVVPQRVWRRQWGLRPSRSAYCATNTGCFCSVCELAGRSKALARWVEVAGDSAPSTIAGHVVQSRSGVVQRIGQLDAGTSRYMVDWLKDGLCSDGKWRRAQELCEGGGGPGLPS